MTIEEMKNLKMIHITISREEALNVINMMRLNGSANVCVLTELPPVAPSRLTGHWIVHDRGDYEFLECDNCQTWFRHDHLIRNSFCPNCGAEMGENK